MNLDDIRNEFMRICDLYESVIYSIKESPEKFVLSGILINDLRDEIGCCK